MEDPKRAVRGAYDVCVIGGGPAGCAAALTLLGYSKLSVAVVERSVYDTVRYGETVPPSLQPLLRYLGVWELFLAQRHLPAYGTGAAWGSSRVVSRDFLFTGRGDGWHLDRRLFDLLLADQVVARGGDFLTRTRLSHCERADPGRNAVAPEKPGEWRVELLSEGSAPSELSARFLIDATGRRGSLARKLGARRLTYDLLVGVVGFFDLPPGERPHRVLVESCASGWWYSAPLPGGGAVAAFFTDSDLVRASGLLHGSAFSDLLAASPQTHGALGGARLRSSPRLVPASSQRLLDLAGFGWIAAGDAAASFDPLASLGIGHAVTSGIHAARTAYDSLLGEGGLLAHYAKGFDRTCRQYLDLRERTYGFERRFAGQPFWDRRQRREPGSRLPLSA